MPAGMMGAGIFFLHDPVILFFTRPGWHFRHEWRACILKKVMVEDVRRVRLHRFPDRKCYVTIMVRQVDRPKR